MRTTAPSERRALVQAWVPHDLAADLRELATVHDRSVAAEVRAAIRRYLESSEAAPGQGGFAKTRDDGARHGGE